MKNMELLWEYQEIDLALEKRRKELADTPTRRKLVQITGVIKNAQNALAEMENTARVQQNSISELDGKNKALIADLEDLSKDMGYYSECGDDELDQKEIEEFIKNCEKANEASGAVKKQLTSLKNELEQSEKQIVEQIQRLKAAKVKYDALRAEYETEMKDNSGETAELEAKLKEKEAALGSELMAEYRRIKGIRQNPVAMLRDNRCSGCRMQLPERVTTDITGTDRIVECENCGRILVII